jgi:hypothetical protein
VYSVLGDPEIFAEPFCRRVLGAVRDKKIRARMHDVAMLGKGRHEQPISGLALLALSSHNVISLIRRPGMTADVLTFLPHSSAAMLCRDFCDIPIMLHTISLYIIHP